MLETLWIVCYPVRMNMGENALRADNQQGSRPKQWVDPSETTRRTPFRSYKLTAVS